VSAETGLQKSARRSLADNADGNRSEHSNVEVSSVQQCAGHLSGNTYDLQV
jgi:hypothetical protein